MAEICTERLAHSDIYECLPPEQRAQLQRMGMESPHLEQLAALREEDLATTAAWLLTRYEVLTHEPVNTHHHA